MTQMDNTAQINAHYVIKAGHQFWILYGGWKEDTCIINQYVQATKLIDCRIDKATIVILDGHIADYC